MWHTFMILLWAEYVWHHKRWSLYLELDLRAWREIPRGAAALLWVISIFTAVRNNSWHMDSHYRQMVNQIVPQFSDAIQISLQICCISDCYKTYQHKSVNESFIDESNQPASQGSVFDSYEYVMKYVMNLTHNISTRQNWFTYGLYICIAKACLWLLKRIPDESFSCVGNLYSSTSPLTAGD